MAQQKSVQYNVHIMISFLSSSLLIAIESIVPVGQSFNNRLF